MRRSNAMAVVMTISLLVAAPLGAQEDDLRREFVDVVAAWSNQDAEAFCMNWMPDYQGFMADGGLMTQSSSCNPTVMQAQFDAGYDPSVTVRHLTVRVHGDFAAVACYLVGTIALGPETVLSGPFRFTGAMVRDGGTWKAIQYHFSPLDPM